MELKKRRPDADNIPSLLLIAPLMELKNKNRDLIDTVYGF